MLFMSIMADCVGLLQKSKCKDFMQNFIYFVLLLKQAHFFNLRANQHVSD